METVRLFKLNETYMKIQCSESVLRELSERFSYEDPNAKFNPKVRSGYWDGVFRLVDSGGFL